MCIVSLLELTSAGQQIDGDNEGKQDVDGGEQDGLHCRDNQLREQEEAARKHQSHENDSCENSSGRDGYVDKVDVLADLTDLALVLIVLFMMQPPNGAEQGGQGRIPRPTEIIERA